MFGTSYAIPYSIENINEEYVEDINKLISLRALELTEQNRKDDFIELLDKDEDAVRKFIRYARGTQNAIEDETPVELYHDIVKGQIRESINKNKDFRLAPLSERKEMEQMGIQIKRKS